MIKWLDRLALAGIATGIALILWPSEKGLLRLGFFVTAAFTVLHVVTSHIVATKASE